MKFPTEWKFIKFHGSKHSQNSFDVIIILWLGLLVLVLCSKLSCFDVISIHVPIKYVFPLKNIKVHGSKHSQDSFHGS